jgi:hypothetical protein
VSEDSGLEHPNGWAAYENVEQFLDVDGWFPQQLDGMTAFVSGFNGEHGRFHVVTHVNITLEQLYVYALAGFVVPENRRAEVAEFITRANYGMRVGNFELDLGDGEVRFKVSIDFEGGELTTWMLRNSLYPAARTLDRYLPGLEAVALHDVDPHHAVDQVERPGTEPPNVV